jgi:predicted transposase YbfD/YdcC
MDSVVFLSGSTLMKTALHVLREVEDPRRHNIVHRLGDLIVIAVASALCGGSTCVDFAQFARSKRAVLEAVLGPFAPPSHDTFSRVFRQLDPEAFARRFADFAAAFAHGLSGVVAIDGKALRRAYTCGLAAAPPLMVTAWAVDARLALAGAMPDPRKGGEAAAALAVLDMLDLKGCIVTADALHCNRAMAERIVERGGDYALCLKGNQARMLSAARALLDNAHDAPAAESRTARHGRLEWRRARVVEAPDFGRDHGFAGACAIAEVTSRRDRGEDHTRLFVLSQHMTPDTVLATVRAHWGIENNLHWSLDVIFNEDAIRSRLDNAPANLALINRAAINIINAIDDPKTPKRRRSLRCAWEDDYLKAALTYMR